MDFSLDQVVIVLEYQNWVDFCTKVKEERYKELFFMTVAYKYVDEIVNDKEKTQSLLNSHLERKIETQLKVKHEIAYCLALLSAQSLEEKIQEELEEEH